MSPLRRLLLVLALAACGAPPAPPAGKAVQPPPPPPACSAARFHNAFELAVYRSRDSLPSKAAAIVPADFDFARFELAALDQPAERYVIVEATQVSACAEGRKIVDARSCGHGRQEAPLPALTLWKLPHDGGHVWFEELPLLTGCAP